MEVLLCWSSGLIQMTPSVRQLASEKTCIAADNNNASEKSSTNPTLLSVAEYVVCKSCNFAILCTALSYTTITHSFSHLNGLGGDMDLFLCLGLHHHRCISSETHTVNYICLITSTFVGLCLSSEKGKKKPLSQKSYMIRVLIINIRAH